MLWWRENYFESPQTQGLGNDKCYELRNNGKPSPELAAKALLSLLGLSLKDLAVQIKGVFKNLPANILPRLKTATDLATCQSLIKEMGFDQYRALIELVNNINLNFPLGLPPGTGEALKVLVSEELNDNLLQLITEFEREPKQ